MWLPDLIQLSDAFGWVYIIYRKLEESTFKFVYLAFLKKLENI